MLKFIVLCEAIGCVEECHEGQLTVSFSLICIGCYAELS